MTATVVLLSLFAALILAVIFLAIVARANRLRDDDGPDTIIIPPAEEPLGERVDVRALMKRWEAE